MPAHPHFHLFALSAEFQISISSFANRSPSSVLTKNVEHNGKWGVARGVQAMTSARGTAEGAIARARAKERERERERNMNSPFQGDKHRIAPEEALSGAEKEMEVIDEAGAVVPYSKRKLERPARGARPDDLPAQCRRGDRQERRVRPLQVQEGAQYQECPCRASPR